MPWMTAKERAEAAFIQPHQQRLACHVIREDRAAVLERLKAFVHHSQSCHTERTMQLQVASMNNEPYPPRKCICNLDETIAEILERTNETR